MIKHTFSIVSLMVITPTINATHAGEWLKETLNNVTPAASHAASSAGHMASQAGHIASELASNAASAVAHAAPTAGHIASQVGNAVIQNAPTSDQIASAAQGVATTFTQDFYAIEQELSTIDPKMVFNAVIVLGALEGCKMAWRYYWKPSMADSSSQGAGMDSQVQQQADDALSKTRSLKDPATQGYVDEKVAGVKEVMNNMIKQVEARQDATDKKLTELDTRVSKSLKELMNEDAKNAAGLKGLSDLIHGDSSRGKQQTGILSRLVAMEQIQTRTVAAVGGEGHHGIGERFGNIFHTHRNNSDSSLNSNNNNQHQQQQQHQYHGNNKGNNDMPTKE